MATTTQTKMTAEEFLALPDDGVHRELIRGEIREYPDMTTRNANHAFVATRISQALGNWIDRQVGIIGVVVSGDARCRLATDPENIVGIDVAVFFGEAALDTVEQSGTFEGPPVLAVEILSPSDTHENVVEKIQLYLEANTPQIWIVDPDIKTVTVHRPNDSPVLYNRQQSINGEPEIAGFQAEISSFFSVRRTKP